MLLGQCLSFCNLKELTQLLEAAYFVNGKKLKTGKMGFYRIFWSAFSLPLAL